MVRDLVRFNREAPALVGLNGGGPSLGDFLDDGGYSREFVDQLIVPQASAVWSADPAQMWTFPASMLAEFFDNHGMFGLTGRPKWRTVVGGSRSYVEAIARPLGDRLRLDAPVTRVERFEDRVEVTPAGGEPEEFDEVVLATHSDQALAMLADPTDPEAEVLGAVDYQPNEAVLHTDRSLLPRRRRAWASWNFHLLDEAPAQTTVTYRMNSLQALRSKSEICVTLNRSERIDPAKVIGTYPYAHPVFTHEALAAQRRWDEVSGRNRTHFCGAWWGYGFHEDGVQSALKVCESFDRARV
jgi:predicted NAD/FAD-binding protein